MKKYNIILHSTTSCNFNCSYCNVIKDNKSLDEDKVSKIISFIELNHKYINSFKFFWWEPLLAWKNIKRIIDNTVDIIWKNFEVVTNTSLINNEICAYMEKYFKVVFFSIDSENLFDYEKVFQLIDKFNLKKKTYFNLIISPWKELIAMEQFEKIYKKWYKNFNILPVYYTKIWEKEDLRGLSVVLRNIMDKSLADNEIRLYWFQLNDWYNISLIKESLFIDIDLKVYYSDFVSTYIWNKIRNDLLLWELESISLKCINIYWKETLIFLHENEIISKVKWQKELHKIMDYFSIYLNKKKLMYEPN